MIPTIFRFFPTFRTRRHLYRTAPPEPPFRPAASSAKNEPPEMAFISGGRLRNAHRAALRFPPPGTPRAATTRTGPAAHLAVGDRTALRQPHGNPEKHGHPIGTVRRPIPIEPAPIDAGIFGTDTASRQTKKGGEDFLRPNRKAPR